MHNKRRGTALLITALLALTACGEAQAEPSRQTQEKVVYYSGGDLTPTTMTHPTTTTSTTAPPVTTTTVPTTTTEAPIAPAPTPPTSGYADPANPETWHRLAACESVQYGWTANTGNGFYGGLQFALGTWQSVGGAGYPHEASVAEQILRGQILQARSGWGQWPSCTRQLGYR